MKNSFSVPVGVRQTGMDAKRRKVHEIVLLIARSESEKRIVRKQLIIFCCLLLCGCAGMSLPALQSGMSQQIEHVNRQDVQRSVRPGKTSDIDILHTYGRPANISQISDGQKMYVYTMQDNVKIKSIRFLFSEKGRLKTWMFSSHTPQFVVTQSIPVEGEDIMVRLLERIPARANKKQLQSFLGRPAVENKSVCTYLFRSSSPLSSVGMAGDMSVTFIMNRSGRVDSMILAKSFHDGVSQWAHFRVQTLVADYRGPDEREAAAIAEYEHSVRK